MLVRGGWRRWVVALSSVAVVACGPALTGGVSAWRGRDRLAEWTAAWMPFLPPPHPASDPRAKALVETLTSELAARTAEAAEGGAEGDLALTIGRDGAWTLETLPPELGWEAGADGLGALNGLRGNRAPALGSPVLPIGIGPAVPLTVAPAPAARPTAPVLVNGKVPQVVIRPGGPPAITLDEILANAKKYVGVPYVWGGNSASGLDCSAYVSKAWGVGRYTTDSIGAVSFKITKDDLLPGDILNLTMREDPRGYGHVRLFAGWANAERTRMWVYEETPPKALFHAMAYDNSYTPMRRVNYVPDGSAAEALEAALKAGATAAPKGSTGPGPGPVGAPAPREQKAPNAVVKAVEDAAKLLTGGAPLPGPRGKGNSRSSRPPAPPTPTAPPRPSKSPTPSPTPKAASPAPNGKLGAQSAATANVTWVPTATNAAVPSAISEPASTRIPPTATRVPPTATRVPPTATRRAQTSRSQVVSIPTAVPTTPPAPVMEPTARPTRTARPQPTVQIIQEPTARPARPTATTAPPPPSSPTTVPPRPTRTAVLPTQPPASPTQPPAPTAQPTTRPVQPTRPPAPAPTQVPAAQPTVRAAQPTARPAQPTATTRPNQGNGGTGGNGNTNGNGNGRNRR